MQDALTAPGDLSPSTAIAEEAVSSVRDYITLLKPRVMSLVVFCGLTGMIVAPGTLHPLQQFITILCIALGSGGSGAINMWFDRDIDAHMLRTLSRPVPAGRIAPADALAFGVTTAFFSVMLLGLAVNWLAAAVLLAAIATYVFVYTVWLKRRTPQNIVIGGAAGAFPPMIGWAAVTGSLSIEPLLLFLIIFLWTPPHFWALALYRHGDYARVGVPMLPVVRGQAATKRGIMLYTLLLVATSLLPYATPIAGLVYLISAALLGAGFLYHAWRIFGDTTDRWAKRTFAYSMLYLFILFACLIVDNVVRGQV